MRWLLVSVLFGAMGCATDDDSGFDPDYCPPVEEWNAEWVAFESEVANLVDQRRSEGGTCGSESFGRAAPLAVDAALRCAARNHSRDMATRGFFAHESPDGEKPEDRITRAGFEWSAIGENIAQGQRTPAAVMEAWMASPGHCANILDPRFDFIGVGYDGDGAFWTQTFGAH
ncbi:MAG TPA: CAP domain-containing protein [Polyangiaceae bacterium]